MEKMAGYLAIAVMVLLGASALLQEEPRSSTSEYVNATFNTDPSVSVRLEVADNTSERRRGLMYREELPEYRGMLFVYPGEDERAFWMKNTMIPLDIIFLNSSKHVINLETAYPEPNTSDSELTRYRSDAPTQYVIELNAGFAENNSIKKGVKVEWD